LDCAGYFAGGAILAVGCRALVQARDLHSQLRINQNNREIQDSTDSTSLNMAMNESKQTKPQPISRRSMLAIKAAWQASHQAIDELMNHSMSKRNEMGWNEMDKWMIQ